MVNQDFDLTELQIDFCREHEYKCVVTGMNEIVGFANQTRGGSPINGLRHPSHGNASGWYIWCGVDYSSEDDFFEPIHAIHLNERCPEIIKLLGLPPGYRFLVAGEYVDIWFDETLLDG
jgi:hypothetical protein